MRRPRLAGQPSVATILLDKDKAAASFMPSLSQGDTHPPAKVTSRADPEDTVEGPAETPVHFHDQDLGIPTQDVTSLPITKILANKPRLAEYTADAKQIQALKANKRTWWAEITMGEVKWLKLKATLKAFLPSTL